MAQNKKHIVHLIYRLDIGGLERVLINCINALPEDKYNHSIIALTDYSVEFAKLIKTNNVELYSLNKPEGQSWNVYYQIYKLLKSIKADVLHSYNLAALEYQICGFFAGIETRVHAEHGRDIFDPEGKNKKYQLLRKLISPFVHNFVSVSADLHNWLVNTVKINKNKCKLIYNGVNTKAYSPSPNKQVLDNSQQNKFVFGCVGRLQGIKNHKLLLESYTLACEQNAEFANSTQLTLVGDGPLRKELEQLAAKGKKNIWLAGARHDMENIYQSFDVFVMSSLGEGIPMTMLEAMASGLPVISTNVGGIPEITNTNNAILVQSNNKNELAQAMLDMYKIDQIEKLKLESRQLASEKFSEQTMIAQYIEQYGSTKG